MGDDIIEIKPGFGPFKVNLRELFRKLNKTDLDRNVKTTAKRFLMLFKDHNVTPFQIQRFLPQLTPDKLQSIDSLLPELTSDVLQTVAQIFGIRIEWLEGEDNQIYKPNYFYKQPHLFVNAIETLNRPNDGFVAHGLATSKNLNYKKSLVQPIALILVERIRDIGDKEIQRYQIIGDGWDWGYSVARVQLKAMIRMVSISMNRPVPLHIVEKQVLENVLKGNLIPTPFLSGCKLTNPSLEDFTLSDEESVKAKEIEELHDVMNFLEEIKKIPPSFL